MAEIKGTPAAKLGPASGSCESDNLTVPPPCKICRQVERWMPRTVSWAKNSVSRFKAIIKATLESHDEILQSLCGFCMVQDTQTCECFLAEWRSLGFPAQICVKRYSDICLIIPEKRTVIDDCGNAHCLFMDCVELCETTHNETLDPCNNADHLEIMQRVMEVSALYQTKPATAENVVNSLRILFPDSGPEILTVDIGSVLIAFSRKFTEAEYEFLDFLKSRIPAAIGVKYTFARECPE